MWSILSLLVAVPVVAAMAVPVVAVREGIVALLPVRTPAEEPLLNRRRLSLWVHTLLRLALAVRVPPQTATTVAVLFLAQ